MDVAAHIIEPAGFAVSDRNFRRSGMDYLDQVNWTRHDSWTKFEQWRKQGGYRLLLFTTKGATPYLDFRYAASDILLFGRETAGVTQAARTPPTQGWLSRSRQDCARLMSQWQRRWHWVRRCGKSEAGATRRVGHC